MADIAMVKVESGKVKGLDAKGLFVRSVGDSGAVSAQMQNGGIVISYDTGKTKLYDERGSFKKTL